MWGVWLNKSCMFQEGETSHSQSHFSSVQLKDSGMYICTRSYMHKGQIYYKTFAVVLNVQTDGKKITFQT